jgi:hypothetical protein
MCFELLLSYSLPPYPYFITIHPTFSVLLSHVYKKQVLAALNDKTDKHLCSAIGSDVVSALVLAL